MNLADLRGLERFSDCLKRRLALFFLMPTPQNVFCRNEIMSTCFSRRSKPSLPRTFDPIRANARSRRAISTYSTGADVCRSEFAPSCKNNQITDRLHMQPERFSTTARAKASSINPSACNSTMDESFLQSRRIGPSTRSPAMIPASPPTAGCRRENSTAWFLPTCSSIAPKTIFLGSSKKSSATPANSFSPTSPATQR